MLPLVTFRVRNNVDFKTPIMVLKKRVVDILGTRLEPIDLTGAQLVLQARDEDQNLVLEASIANNRIIVADAAMGKIQFSVPKAVMLTVAAGCYRYDLVILSGGEASGLWYGTLEVSQGQTLP